MCLMCEEKKLCEEKKNWLIFLKKMHFIPRIFYGNLASTLHVHVGCKQVACGSNESFVIVHIS